ncbi:MAG: DNA replication/repair protein RecF [Anaerolineae bacterium]|nr:DNA replication/repair protein RecF [Anaerolineae bacterium]
MRLLHLSLTNFRNYARMELSLPAGPILLYGQNAQGKTSILEAVYYLATSRSPWTSSDRQLLNWGAENDVLPFARISAEIDRRDLPTTRIDITLVREAVGGEMRFDKDIKINGVKKRALDLLGTLNVVMFLPQDLAIVEGTPADRRRYLNVTLAQVDRTYAQALTSYEKVLTQRNALLKRIYARQAGPSELSYWDEQLMAAGSLIIAGRQQLLRELEVLAQRVHYDLTAGAELLELRYQPSFTMTGNSTGQLAFDVLGLDIHRQLSPAEIGEQFRTELSRLQREEIDRGVTLVGPQRDELRFSVNGKDLGDYGSRGQARTAVMALKMAELGWMKEAIGEWPVLLLDEFIAELDAARRSYLLDRIDGANQSILTTTEPDIFTEAFRQKAAMWRVSAGQVFKPEA